MNLTLRLIQEGYLKTPRIIRAFEQVPREFFVRAEDREWADDPYSALAIPGENATISAPNVNAIILELLQIKPSEKILDLGIGSGWLAALAAELAGPQGQVYGIEADPITLKFGREKLKKAGIDNIISRQGNGLKGWERHAPYDVIVLTFAIGAVPQTLFSQLNQKTGRLLAPVKNDDYGLDCNLALYLAPDFSRPKISLPGFRFVDSRF